MTHTTEQTEWLQLRDDAKANKHLAVVRFNNTALTVDGDKCIGMSYSVDLSRYSCSYMQRAGERFNEPSRWDKEGGSLDGTSDLNMGTVQQGIRRI